MVKVHYDQVGNISGYYPNSIEYSSIPEPYIEIDDQAHRDCFNNPGLRKVDPINKVIVVYMPPAPTEEELKQQNLTALDAEYQPRFAELSQALGMATLADSTDLIASIKADYAKLKAEYNAKRGEINNG
ncbi:hypothetical protein [Pelosinus sp. IPA-1]|uniref:hypothetical protein n=1 Tax=Pelosinus sp. IPA-1 TaxID=3029569 RepID=UPI0024362690|nr:hypothetical protein [Pelosinus sp. IPA-1]GMB00448.1 hypothetical protein PIPA1_32470 [Pelosinus sp. IPA-1]